MTRANPTPARPVRLQVFVTEACSVELDRLSTEHGVSRSEAAAQAMLRGMRHRVASNEDRLLQLERRLEDHMRLSTRDLRIVEELAFAQLRVLLNRLPEAAEDHNPVRKAAIETRLQRVLDDVAARIAGGPRRPAPGPEASNARPDGDLSLAIAAVA